MDCICVVGFILRLKPQVFSLLCIIGNIVEPLGGLLVLLLLGWLGYEVYRKYSADEEFAHRIDAYVSKGEHKFRETVDQITTELRSILSARSKTADTPRVTQSRDSHQSARNSGNHNPVTGSNTDEDARQQSGTDGDAPFDWYGDTEISVDEVLECIDTELDPQTRARIKTSVQEHRERGEEVDAADIRWIAEATEELDFEGDHP